MRRPIRKSKQRLAGQIKKRSTGGNKWGQLVKASRGYLFKKGNCSLRAKANFSTKKIANQSRQAWRPEFYAILTKNSDISKAIHSLTGQVGVFLLLNIIRFVNIFPCFSLRCVSGSGFPKWSGSGSATLRVRDLVFPKNWQYKKREKKIFAQLYGDSLSDVNATKKIYIVCPASVAY